MIDQTLVIAGATAQELYEALLDSQKHTEIIGDEAVIDPVVGGTFTAFSGYADGKITELVPNKRIAQTWRASDWPKGHYSNVVFEFTDTPKGAQIHFVQSNLFKGTIQEFEAGWEDNYWTKLQQYFA